MELLSGKKIADGMLAELKDTIVREKLLPKLSVILVGDDPASHLYVRLKKNAAEKIGVHFEITHFPYNVEKNIIENHIHTLNLDRSVHGVLIQLPLPNGYDENFFVQQIHPLKDADGFHRETLQSFLTGDREAEPVFPRAIATLIRSAHKNLQGEKAIAIVNSEIFGKIIEQSLKNLGLNPRVFLLNEFMTQGTILREATVVISACGQARMITGDMLSPNVIVIDGGISIIDGKAVGDVDFESVKYLPGFLSPVPGGVGPVTVASLLVRVVESARRKIIG